MVVATLTLRCLSQGLQVTMHAEQSTLDLPISFLRKRRQPASCEAAEAARHAGCLRTRNTDGSSRPSQGEGRPADAPQALPGRSLGRAGIKSEEKTASLLQQPLLQTPEIANYGLAPSPIPGAPLSTQHAPPC